MTGNRSTTMSCARLAFLLALVLAVPAAAQDRPVTMLPVPPLPPIGLPLPHIGLPPPADTPAPAPPRATGPRTAQGRDARPLPGRRGGERGTALVPLYVTPFYLLAPSFQAPAEKAPAPPPAVVEPEPATLRLDVEPPADSQVYVDGYYIGITDGTDAFELTAGAHHVELRARDYEPLVFDVRLSTRQPVVYRDRLRPVRTAAEEQTQARSVAVMTVYVIPGCYAGNVPPDAATLPSGCDPARVTTLPR